MMSRHAIPVGRILGIPIDLDPSWFLVFALLTWTLAVGYYPAEFQGWPGAEYWIVGTLTASLLYASVLLHELGHSVAAQRYGIPVRRITLFIFGGVAQIQLQTFHALLAGHTVAESMSRSYPEIAGDTVLKELLDDPLLRQGRGSTLVKSGDDVVGLLTPQAFEEEPQAKWPTTTVAQVMVPVARMQWVRPDTDLEAALEAMDRAGVSQLPVMASGRVVGMLSRAGLIAFFRRLQPLNGSGWSPAR